MADIEVALNFAIAQSGKPYSTRSGRFGPDHYDCSGLIIRALAEAGVPLPNGISVEREWGNTVSVYYWARDVGALVSVEKAAQTRGAILLRGRWWGYGPVGHIEFSLADGREVGAHSSRSGIGVRNSDLSRYHDGVIFPGVNYGAPEPPPPVWKVRPMFDPPRQLRARLRHPEGLGWWDGYEGGRVDWLPNNSDDFRVGGMISENDRKHFGERTLARLEHRTYPKDGVTKHGYTIFTTDGATYVPEDQR